MTQQEFVNLQSKEANTMGDIPKIAYQIGLTRGLEIAKEIIQQLTGEDEERSKLLLNKFLTQKYEE